MPNLVAEVMYETRTDFIHEDRHGLIWLAFGGFITVFDGVNERTFVHSAFDSTTISAGNYFAIATGPDDATWIGTAAGSGLNRMTGYGGRIDRWGVFPADPRGLTGSLVTGILIDRLGRVWVSTTRGLNEFDERTGGFVQYRHDPADPTSLPGEGVGSMAENDEKSMWIGTNEGLGLLDIESGTFEPFPFQYEVHPSRGVTYPYDRYVHESVRSIFVDREGVVWVVLAPFASGPSGFEQFPYGLLARFNRDDGSFQVFESVQDGTFLTVSSIVQDANGRYWAATNLGLAAFSPSDGSFELVTLKDQRDEIVRGTGVTRMALDREGALWLNLGEQVLRVSAARQGVWTHSTLRGSGQNRTKTGWVDAVILSRDGRTLWFSTGNEELKTPTGLTRLDRATGLETHYRHDPNDPTSLSDNFVRALGERSDGKIWVAGGFGLNLLDPATGVFEHYYIHGDSISSSPPATRSGTQPESGTNSNWINAIWPVSDTQVWLATGTQWIVLVDVERGTKKAFRLDTPFPEDAGYTADVLVAHDGSVWAIVRGGAVRLDPETGEVETFFHDASDPSSIGAVEGTSIYEDDRGRIWTGSYGGGLSLYVPEISTWRHFGRDKGLPADLVACVLGDHAGYIWVSTPQGISRFDVENETFENYWVVDGLQGDRFAGEACTRALSGQLLFGGERGFNMIDPDSLGQSSTPPGVVLTSIRVSGEVLKPGLDPRLPVPLSKTHEIPIEYDENNIVFEYAGVDFGHTGARTFQHRLEPLESEWQDAGDRAFVSYANLDPGEYTFKVQLSVAGRVSPSPASVRIVIAPPWWRTWWARILFGLAVVGILFTGYSYRIRRLKADSLRLEAEVFNRTRDLEEEKRKTEEQARRLLELDETKNRFFANISHEFRTPLTLIIGPLQDAIEGSLDGDPVGLRRQLGVMLDNARRVLRLINQLLDLSKLESGKLEIDAAPGDLIASLQTLARRFTPAAERRRLEFTCQTDRSSLPALFDEDKLEKIVTNLVSNALKFTPEGGKVGLAIETHQEDERTARVTIMVRDTGRGIASEELDRVFDRFHQVDQSTTREFEGTGIGLSLAKELTELMGGTISVESQLNFGTTFRVELPVELVDSVDVEEVDGRAGEIVEPIEASVPTADVEEPAADPSDSQTESEAIVLVVEDNPEVRAYIKSQLSDRYTILEAENGQEGLERARKELPDLILSDVMMPKMDGYEMVRKLRDIPDLRHTPIVLLTAKADESEAVEGIQAGADDYLTKPFGSAELEARVSALIKRRREMRAQFSEEVVVKGPDIVVTSEDARFIERVIEIVDERLDDANFGSDWLADEVGLSRRQLERKLDEVMGESPSALIRRLRLERASKLLRAQAGTVAEIAYSVGFTNAAYFTRAFKKAYGESPTEHAEDGR